jgi:serine/threonine protein kinase
VFEIGESLSLQMNYVYIYSYHVCIHIFEQGDVPGRKMVAVKRFIGVGIPVNKFRMEAEQFKSLDHKNIVKVVSYCHDESRKKRLVEFKGQDELVVFDGPEQLLCYEYMHNGSLRDYLIGTIQVTNNLPLDSF